MQITPRHNAIGAVVPLPVPSFFFLLSSAAKLAAKLMRPKLCRAYSHDSARPRRRPRRRRRRRRRHRRRRWRWRHRGMLGKVCF